MQKKVGSGCRNQMLMPGSTCRNARFSRGQDAGMPFTQGSTCRKTHQAVGSKCPEQGVRIAGTGGQDALEYTIPLVVYRTAFSFVVPS